MSQDRVTRAKGHDQFPDDLKGFVKERNTYKRDVKADPADRIQVEIGDSKQDDFKPQVKIMRWDNEVNFSIRASEVATANIETRDEKVRYIAADYEVHMYEKPEAGEDGGFEFEWILPTKPKSNVLTATIQTKGLNFFYQPPLTDEIKPGRGETVTETQHLDSQGNVLAERPENVVGSYAAYHKSKRNNRVGGKEYKTGKAFHIYRPHVTDAEGNETWAELNITGNDLTVTVPQGFLDKAVYPVIVDPTFGYTTIGASTRDSRSILHGSSFSLGEKGDVSKITAYWNNRNTPAKAAIYDDNDKSFIGETGEVAANSGSAWRDLAFSSQVNLASGSYMLILRNSGGSQSKPFNCDTVTGSGIGRRSGVIAYSDPWPDSWSDNPSGGSEDLKFSIYATYEAAEEPTAHPLSRWTGNEWESAAGRLKRWNGSEWEEADDLLKRYDGSDWA